MQGDNLRIMSIDPGAANMGVSIMDYNPYRNHFTSRLVHTINFEAVAVMLYGHYRAFQPDRQLRMMSIQHAIGRYLSAWTPDVIVSEAPFMRDKVQAFASLTECIAHIKTAAFNYSPLLEVVTIDPPTVKRSVGVPGNSGDKTLMHSAVLKLPNLTNSTGMDFQLLDEHSVDSIAVGYAYANRA